MQVVEFSSTAAQRYSDPRLEVDFRAKTVRLDLRPIRLTHMEFDLLAFLAQYVGRTVPRDELLRLVWGYGPAVRTRTLDVHIRRLRKKLGDFGLAHIETVFRIGYRLRHCDHIAAISSPAAG